MNPSFQSYKLAIHPMLSYPVREKILIYIQQRKPNLSLLYRWQITQPKLKGFIFLTGKKLHSAYSRFLILYMDHSSSSFFVAILYFKYLPVYVFKCRFSQSNNELVTIRILISPISLGANLRT